MILNYNHDSIIKVQYYGTHGEFPPNSRPTESVTFDIAQCVTLVCLFREYPDPKVRRASMVTSVPPALWDLRVYLVRRYVVTDSFNDLINEILFYALLPIYRQGYPGLKGEKGEKGESVSVRVCQLYRTVSNYILSTININ